MKHIEESYGVLEQDSDSEELSHHCENIRRKGFTVLADAVDPSKLELYGGKFDDVLGLYQKSFGYENLKACDEHNGIRMPFYFDRIFLDIASNKAVLDIVFNLMGSNFQLKQQNGINNPGRENYNQSKWHRDLPYSNYVSTRPLMLNALFCLDDFKIENGATRVIPGSHLFEKFPSDKYIDENTAIAEAKAGSYIILDSMLFHSGTSNTTSLPRRAINNVYSSPHIKQQIEISPENTIKLNLSASERKLLGVDFQVYSSVENYLGSRKDKL